MDAKVTGAVVAAVAVAAGGIGAVALRTSSQQPETMAYRVYAEKRGDLVVPVLELRDGGHQDLDEFPCAIRPKGAPVSSCTRIDDTDQGEENVMQPGQWKGDGCRRTACVERAR
jgi:hypothetical protein